jgi:hypothetical protein
MSPKSDRKRPAPDAYDHLWPQLPVFVAVLATILIVIGF